MSEIKRSDICIVACADAFRGDGEIMVSPMGLTPSIGARLARATFEKDMVLTDGVSSIISGNYPVGKGGQIRSSRAGCPTEPYSIPSGGGNATS